MGNKKNENLSKVDIISFIALLILSVMVFFGMNFQSLGDKVPSILVALLLLVLMVVSVFLAAFAKAQNRNQSMWKSIEYSMLALYVICLIPCYLYSAKFFDIQFDKVSIIKQASADVSDIDKMFSDYNRKCESRATGYQTTLEAMLKDDNGRQQIAKMLDISVNEVDAASVAQAGESFSAMLRGTEYRALEAEKSKLKSNVENNFVNWNILNVPLYVSQLGLDKEMYASKLEEIYNKHHNSIEEDVPSFDASQYVSESNLMAEFSSAAGFSLGGLLSVLVLGILGFVKYMLGEKRTVKEFKLGDGSVINNGGGLTL